MPSAAVMNFEAVVTVNLGRVSTWKSCGAFGSQQSGYSASPVLWRKQGNVQRNMATHRILPLPCSRNKSGREIVSFPKSAVERMVLCQAPSGVYLAVKPE